MSAYRLPNDKWKKEKKYSSDQSQGTHTVLIHQESYQWNKDTVHPFMMKGHSTGLEMSFYFASDFFWKKSPPRREAHLNWVKSSMISRWLFFGYYICDALSLERHVLNIFWTGSILHFLSKKTRSKYWRNVCFQLFVLITSILHFVWKYYGRLMIVRSKLIVSLTIYYWLFCILIHVAGHYSLFDQKRGELSTFSTFLVK